VRQLPDQHTFFLEEKGDERMRGGNNQSKFPLQESFTYSVKIGAEPLVGWHGGTQHPFTRTSVISPASEGHHITVGSSLGWNARISSPAGQLGSSKYERQGTIRVGRS